MIEFDRIPKEVFLEAEKYGVLEKDILFAAHADKNPEGVFCDNWVLITEDEMVKFLEISLSRAGADQLITPREMLRDYMTVLNILMQNNDATFEQIINASHDTVTDNNDKKESEVKAQHVGYSAADIEF